MARPTKLTDELIVDLARAIETGMPYEQACKQSGIAYSTFNNWENGRFPQGVSETMRARFLEAIKRAQAELAFELLTSIRNAGMEDRSGSWQAAAWMLERKFPQHFRRRPLRAGSQQGGLETDEPTLGEIPLHVVKVREDITTAEAEIDGE